ncbi:hypothetical protein [Burkholderia sp.]|uniref:hypothetical protein n=1 Tax=Burkholderia sp. TaxID=36773 RepID=UPI00258E4D80|nr:hypothetical protein [Burkholderia sp.]MCL4631554.1 hypothetical protein [Burkholderia sp.]
MTSTLNSRSADVALDFVRFALTRANRLIKTRLRRRKVVVGFEKASVAKLRNNVWSGRHLEQSDRLPLERLRSRNAHRAVVRHSNQVSNFLVRQDLKPFKLGMSLFCQRGTSAILGIYCSAQVFQRTVFHVAGGDRYCVLHINGDSCDRISVPCQGVDLSCSGQARDDKLVRLAPAAIGARDQQCDRGRSESAQRDRAVHDDSGRINVHSDWRFRQPHVLRLSWSLRDFVSRDVAALIGVRGNADRCHSDTPCHHDIEELPQGWPAIHDFPDVYLGAIVARPVEST